MTGCVVGYHQPNSYGQGGVDSFNMMSDHTGQQFHLGQDKFDNFTCGRIDLMGNIVTKSAPYLYPFVIEFSLIIAAILLVMWLRIGKNPRWVSSLSVPCGPKSAIYFVFTLLPFNSFYWPHRGKSRFYMNKLYIPRTWKLVKQKGNIGLIIDGMFVRFWGDDELDRLSVTSRKMVTYTRVDCVGASKGLFFGLLVLVSALICLILFFVLIDHGELHVSQLAVFLADISHATIMLLSLLAILIGFCRCVESQLILHSIH